MRVAICIDQEAPSELVRDALTIGKALIEKGHAASFVAGDPITLVDNSGSWVPKDLHQAPIRRRAPDLVMKRPSLDGFSDLMALLGFDDRHTLMTVATIWSQQLQMLKPDVVLGLYSPVLWLVAPKYAPTIALGNGFALPPILGKTFPRLSAETAPLADDESMFANANTVLARLGQPALAGLTDVLQRCKPFLYGLAAFDPYLQLRRNLSQGLLGERPVAAVLPAKQRIAAFLDVNCPGVETIMLALTGVAGVSIDICLVGATAGMRRYLEQQPHVVVWSDYSSLLQQLDSVNAVVHHGVHDVAQSCVYYGRPQLMVPFTAEQKLFEVSTRWMSVSWVKSPTVSIDELAGTFRAILKNGALAVAAQHQARQMADAGLPNALPLLFEQIEKSALR